ncbi:MAG: MATE family efflux transporter [Clostridiales bacterium]|nr:MATE family efflux transporter [Clostridiales bacterium]
MGVMPVRRLLVAMSLPMMISMLVQALYNIVDSIFVSNLSENALTAVSLAFPIQCLIIAFAVGTNVGLNAFLSKSLGEKNFKAANKCALNGLFLAALSAIAFMLLGIFFSAAFFKSQTGIEEISNYGTQYLSIVCIGSVALFMQILFERLLASTGMSLGSMISQIAGAATNIILDPIMIFGLFGFPRMEVAGAALATVIGQLVGASIGLALNLRLNKQISLNIKGFRPDWSIIRKIYAVGLPSILMQAVGSVMTYGLNLILISFTETAAAVLGVYFKLQSFVFMPVFGLNNGMVPIIAYNFGARNKKRIVETMRLSILYALVIMAAGTAVFEVIPERMLTLFNASDQMMEIGIPALRIVAVHFVFAAFCIIVISVFQALGNGVETLYISIARQIVILLPAAWLLSLTGSVGAVWWAFPISEAVSLALCIWFLKRIYGRKIKVL